MKTHPTMILAAGIAIAIPCLLFAQSRTWTNTDGQTMEAEIVNVEGDQVVFSRNGRTYNYPIANLTEDDREAVRSWAEEDQKRRVVAEALEGELVRRSGSRLADLPPEDLASKRLFAFYYSAGWCGPCRAFTPDLVAFYEEARETHPEFEIIFVSSDQDENAMVGYMRDYDMSWPAVRFDRTRSIGLVERSRESGIPNLVFVDGSGEVLARSYVDGNYAGPRQVLAEMRSHLE